MAEMLTVESERVDDIPVLVAQQVRMGIPVLLDRHFLVHGNRQGLSLGWTTALWLSFVLTEADHRLSHVQKRVEQRLETLRRCSEQPVNVLDFTDDRLADVLTALSDDVQWQGFESALNQNLLRVYDLSAQRVRVDSTTASGYWTVTEGGLLQLGHSKDRRPDLPQVKVMVSALDPLGMPLVTQVVPGERADDPLYVPAIRQVQESLGSGGLLYVGDSKMGALGTRAFVQASGDYYLCPLSLTQLPAKELRGYLAPVWAGEQGLMPIYREGEDDEQEEIAQGFELIQERTAEVEGQRVAWTERRLVIRSHALAEKAIRGLHGRLTAAQEGLAALTERKRGKKRIADITELRQAAEAILTRYGVVGLLRPTYHESVQEHHVRAYDQRPAETRTERTLPLQVAVDQQAVQAAERALGWRVYATSQPGELLSLSQAVLAYRCAHIIERGFSRLKGKPLSLTPVYLRDDDRIVGLIRLLTIGLRVLTLMEFTVRRRLAQEHTDLAGLYPANPTRATARPTAERLLEAFEGITLTTVHQPGQVMHHLSPLTDLQQRILTLLGFPVSIYTRLAAVSSKPP